MRRVYWENRGAYCEASLCVGVFSQIWDINILILLLYNGSNIVHSAEPNRKSPRNLAARRVLWKTAKEQEKYRLEPYLEKQEGNHEEKQENIACRRLILWRGEFIKIFIGA
ncbi:MAG: hypothetical protein A3I38_03440 [Candidatus Wildermuthbacteria bacterium RIFCSPLOWO2_02_FULL_47_10]|nr:MAG: hypothetical protein A3I38_03440 [Candidatus Wildermuthbacteria bacterium RIFCSPLOWO2_02_FULL_47_10]